MRRRRRRFFFKRCAIANGGIGSSCGIERLKRASASSAKKDKRRTEAAFAARSAKLDA
jgi:hypothetical protein